MKRPNSEYISTLSPWITKDSRIHFIERGDGVEKYILAVTKDPIDPLKIFTIDGEPCTVDYSSNTRRRAYVRNLENPHLNIKCMTIADHTFILNKTVTVDTEKPYESNIGDGGLEQFPDSGVVFIKRGLPATEYTIEISAGLSNSYIASYETPEQTEESPDPMFNTEDIATALADDLKDKLPESYIVEASGSCIFVYNEVGIEHRIAVRDSYGNQAMTVTKGKVQKFADLPPEAPPGTRVTIAGTDGATRGSFYVRYVAPKDGSGYWEETYNPKDEQGDLIPNRLDNETMPITLTRTGEKQFSLDGIPWKKRLVGDEISAPLPSFVGRTINDIFFYKNRFGILSEDSVILSESGEYYNFFPNTVTDVLDGDPIDVAVLTDRIVNLTDAVPLPTSLLLSSDAQQFLLSGAGILSPMTVAVDINSHHKASEICPPVSVGSSVFFVSPSGSYSSLKELYTQPDSTTTDPDDVTAHVPQYLPRNIKDIQASLPTNTLFLLPWDEKKTLYVYSYRWEGDEKVQSAWGKWVLPNREILGIQIINNWLYMVTQGDGGGDPVLERINLDVETLDPLKIQLDLLVKTKGVYDATVNRTTWTIPYSISEKDCKLVDAESGIEFNKPFMPSSREVCVTGDYHDIECFIGVPYTFKYKFSQWYLRDEYGVARTQGKLQIRNLTLSYLDTGYFKLKIQNGKRLHESEFTGTLLGSGLQLGKVSVITGEKRFFIGGSSETVAIEITNDSYLPSRFQIASYEGFYTTRR